MLNEPLAYGSRRFKEYLAAHAHVRGEVQFLRTIVREGMTAIDIGGHIGMATVTIAKGIGPTGMLHTFEPMPEYFDILRRNIAANGLSNVRTHCMAITDRAGECVLHSDGAATSIVPRPGGHTRFTAHTNTLDCFAMQQHMTGLDLLNLDCEGSELLVLRGGRAILTRNHPQVFVEVHHDMLSYFDHDVWDVVATFQGLGFTVRALRFDDMRLTENFASCEYVYARQGKPPSTMVRPEWRIRNRDRLPSRSRNR
jgi:FkbM family methyltransferase